MEQLINYKLTGKQVAEFPEIKLLLDREVLTTIPIAVIEFGKIYDKPYLIPNGNNVGKVVDEQELRKILSNTKIFNFIIEKNKVREAKKDETPQINIRLPKDTNVDELIYHDGQILWGKPIEKDKGE